MWFDRYLLSIFLLKHCRILLLGVNHVIYQLFTSIPCLMLCSNTCVGLGHKCIFWYVQRLFLKKFLFYGSGTGCFSRAVNKLIAELRGVARDYHKRVLIPSLNMLCFLLRFTACDNLLDHIDNLDSNNAKYDRFCADTSIPCAQGAFRRARSRSKSEASLLGEI